MERKGKVLGTACNICINGKNNYPLALLKAENLAKPWHQLSARFQKSSHNISQFCAPACWRKNRRGKHIYQDGLNSTSKLYFRMAPVIPELLWSHEQGLPHRSVWKQWPVSEAGRGEPCPAPRVGSVGVQRWHKEGNGIAPSGCSFSRQFAYRKDSDSHF